MFSPKHLRFLPLLASVLVVVLQPAAATGGMKSTPQLDGTCATTGGGKIVPIPGYAGESIDRRLLNDIRWLERRYSIFITDGYSTDPVHAANGEHPLGLALDIIPDKAAGGTWQDITRLARWAERRPDRPRAPFRWVGYAGDENHGPRHHLHLSWSHSEVGAGRTARTIYSLRCPSALGNPPASPPVDESPPPPPTTGGVDSKHPPTGGIYGGIAPAVPETGGVGR